jgi:hypothetical protein
MEFETQQKVDKYFSRKFGKGKKTFDKMDDIKYELLDAQKQGYKIEKYENKFNEVILKMRKND